MSIHQVGTCVCDPRYLQKVTHSQSHFHSSCGGRIGDTCKNFSSLVAQDCGLIKGGKTKDQGETSNALFYQLLLWWH